METWEERRGWLLSVDSFRMSESTLYESLKKLVYQQKLYPEKQTEEDGNYSYLIILFCLTKLTTRTHLAS